MLVLIAVVVVTEAWAAFRMPALNSGDVALIELRTRDVFSFDPPLVGAYSRYGWSHPGPLLFYVYAVPYRVFGGDALAMRLTALILNTAALLVIAYLLSRRGRLALLAGSIAMVGLIFGLRPNTLVDSWNVPIAVLSFALVIVACWCALCGDRHALAIAAIAYVFVFQAHIGFGVVLAPLIVATVGVLIVQARRVHRPIDRRACTHLGGALVVLFMPVLIDTIVHFPGNIGRLVKWSLVNDEPKVGITQGVRAVARASSLSFLRDPQFPRPFTFEIDHIPLGTGPGVLLAVLGAGAFIATRRRWRPEALLAGILLITWLAAVGAAASIAQPLYFWLVDWLQPLAWMSWGAVAMITYRFVAALPLDPRVRRPIAAITLGVGLTILIVASGNFIDSSVSNATTSSYEDETLESLVSAALTLDSQQQVQVSYDGEALVASSMMHGIINQLDRAEYQVCIDEGLAYLYGDNRVCPGATTRHLIVRGENSALPPPAGARALAIADPLTPLERAEADATTDRLSAILVEHDRSDELPLLATTLVTLILQNNPPAELTSEQAAIYRLSELRQRAGTRVGLYLSGD